MKQKEHSMIGNSQKEVIVSLNSHGIIWVSSELDTWNKRIIGPLSSSPMVESFPLMLSTQHFWTILLFMQHNIYIHFELAWEANHTV